MSWERYYFQTWTKTDVGRKRQHNEDFFLIDPEIGLYAVADGMGGYQAGEVASRLALETLQKAMRSRKDLFARGIQETPALLREIENYLSSTVKQVSYHIYGLGRTKGENFRMGTTLCALILLNRNAYIAHVGDSRCYLWRDGVQYQLTDDHSLISEQLRQGWITAAEAAKANYKNVITRAIGMSDDVEVDLIPIDLSPRDRFLLCSDGLHTYLREEDFPMIFVRERLDTAAADLINLANQRGGSDNITAIIVAVEAQAQVNPMVSDGDTFAGLTLSSFRPELEALQYNPLFRGLSKEDLSQIFPLISEEEVYPGQKLLREGDPPSHLYILQHGRLEVYRGQEKIATLAAGAYVGEVSVFEGSPCSATVLAAERSTCLAISSDALLEIIRQKPSLGTRIQHNMILILCQRLRDTSKALAHTRRELRRIQDAHEAPLP